MKPTAEALRSRRAVVTAAFTDGFEELRIPDGDTITIESIDIVGDVDGLEVVGAYLAGDDREIGAIAWDRPFPPAAPAFGDIIPGRRHTDRTVGRSRPLLIPNG